MSAGESKLGREVYELGPFRVDAERELLLRADDPVNLPPKAFQVLLVLIRHNQEIVTKDDLMKEVWPDTFVEETNLSRNVFLLRKALGESPQDHRYILTVPGKGYRLAESVRLVPDQEISILAASQTKVRIHVKDSQPWQWLAITGTVALLAIAAGVFWFVRHRTPTLAEKDTVVLADFANTTGDPVFDGALRQGLSVQLAQSPYLSLIPDERIHRTLTLMGQSADARLTPQIARALCERTGSTAVLAGSITSLGQQYVLGLRAEDCRTGNVLDEEQAQASRKEDVLNVLSQIAGRFRKRIGESLNTIEKHNIPLAEATTTSLEALRAYSLGWNAIFGPSGPGEAIPFFKRAIEIDPNFASAYAMLGRVYEDMGEAAPAIENTKRAYQLRDRTSDPERFFVESSYDLQVTGNLEKARQTSELWSQTYPRDERPVGLLSFIYQDLGRYDKSIDTGERAIEIDRDFVPGYANLAWAYVLSDRLTEAQHVVQLASERKLEFPDLYILLYDIAFLQNDKAGMERAVALAQGKTGGEHWIMQREACVLAYTGQIRDARAMSRRAIQLAEQAGQPGRAELYRAGVAAREALFGNSEEAKRQALAALGASKDRDVEYGAAFALAMSGDTARVANIIDDLDKRFPEDTFVRFSYLPTLRALVAEHHGNPTKALEYLEAESPYDLGIAGSWAGFLGDMYPVYVRGLAYLALQQGREASVEFQKIVTHRGIVGSDPVGAAALLKLAQAYAIAGEKSKADSAYQQFFALWNDADPDTPVLQLARQEYSTSR